MSANKLENSLTQLLDDWQRSQDGVKSTAFNALIVACYSQLHRMAASRAHAVGAVTLSPTEILHEAIISVGESAHSLKNSRHFLATMSLKMRSLLVDHARANLRDKRGGGDWVRVTMSAIDNEVAEEAVDLVELDQALQSLDAKYPRCAQVLHLLYFASMERDDIAELLQISRPTVDRELRFGRAYAREFLENIQGNVA
jgi:RNA polymerase sigma factor (TIGR02999 family)